MSEAEQNKNEKNILLHQCHYPSCFLCHLTAPAAKKGKKVKEPEAPILYSDPPDKMNSKDGRAANMKITSWNVDGLRAWVKKKGLDVSLGTRVQSCMTTWHCARNKIVLVTCAK